LTETAPAGETMDICIHTCKVTLKLNRQFVHPANILAVSNFSGLHYQRKAGRLNRNNTKMKKDRQFYRFYLLPLMPEELGVGCQRPIKKQTFTDTVDTLNRNEDSIVQH